MEINKPIFIVGVGRSGSTIFHEIFCRHPQVTWLSKLCDIFPEQVWLNRALMSSIDSPLVGAIFRSFIIEKKIIKPSEAYNFWELNCTGFSYPCRDLCAEDVTNKKKARIKKVFAKMLTSRRQRLLVKITGWPRIDFLQEIFGDAKFIHIVRDGRAVVNSMLEVDFWEGWRGPQGWRWGELTPMQRAEWEKYNRSFVALAAIEMNILMEAMEQAKSKVKPENFLEIKYEDLCVTPIDTFKDVVKFCQLDWNPKFGRTIESFELKNTNYKWQKELTPGQHKILEKVLIPYNEKYRYLDFRKKN